MLEFVLKGKCQDEVLLDLYIFNQRSFQIALRPIYVPSAGLLLIHLSSSSPGPRSELMGLRKIDRQTDRHKCPCHVTLRSGLWGKSSSLFRRVCSFPRAPWWTQLGMDSHPGKEKARIINSGSTIYCIRLKLFICIVLISNGSTVFHHTLCCGHPVCLPRENQ